MALNLTSVYLHVVQDVISNVRPDFHSEGVDDTVLHQLQSIWELKMMQIGAIQASSATSFPRGGNTGITSVHDLNVPYEATEEYETSTAEMLFPPKHVSQTLLHTPLQERFTYHYLPPGPSDSTKAGISGNVKLEKPATYMQQSIPWMSQKRLGVNVNIAYEEGRDDKAAAIGQPPVTEELLTLSAGKRKRDDVAPNFLSGSHIPQQDGAGDNGILSLSLEKAACRFEAKKAHQLKRLTKWEAESGFPGSVRNEDRNFANVVEATCGNSQLATPCTMPQIDGVDDHYDDDIAGKHYKDPGEEEMKALKAEGAESDESEPPLNEDDDDEDLDDLGGDEALNTEDLVLAQFEKVTRSKNKWKCILTDGVMHLHGRDYLFAKANGEFEF